MAAIGQEYRAKLDDLAHKYALRVTVEWVQTLELVMPVHRLTVQIRRRKAERVDNAGLEHAARADWSRRPARRAGRPSGRAWCATTRCIWSVRLAWRLVPAAAAHTAVPATRTLPEMQPRQYGQGVRRCRGHSHRRCTRSPRNRRIAAPDGLDVPLAARPFRRMRYSPLVKRA